MHRLCYRCLLRFHPARFCERFAEEMLSIFDHVEGRALRSKLLSDAFISLLRQWSIRPQNGEQKAPAGIPISAKAAPAFFTLGEFKVRKSALFCRAAHLINSLPTLISELCVVSAPSGLPRSNPGVWASSLALVAPALLFSYSCGLFVLAKRVNPFAIKQIQPLFRKHPGYGVHFRLPIFTSHRSPVTSHALRPAPKRKNALL